MGKEDDVTRSSYDESVDRSQRLSALQYTCSNEKRQVAQLIGKLSRRRRAHERNLRRHINFCHFARVCRKRAFSAQTLFLGNWRISRGSFKHHLFVHSGGRTGMSVVSDGLSCCRMTRWHWMERRQGTKGPRSVIIKSLHYKQIAWCCCCGCKESPYAMPLHVYAIGNS
jgi:hypothetical protein